MKTIKDLLKRDLGKRIEEIIKVSQTDEQSVYDEITEYVATEKIRDQYLDVLKAIAEAPAEPHEGVGVWISGFFGSGKSSFAKNLGYVLANGQVLGYSAADLFKTQVQDPRLADVIDSINRRIPTEVVMFDLSVDRAVVRGTERLAEVMYRVLLRHLGYAEDYDMAELEIELEKEARLDELVERCQQKFGDWRTVRKGAQKLSRASAILHDMEPTTYPAADSWAKSIASKPADITVGKFVERAFELMARRRPGKALVFVIDEVGQYVARSADKIEDLRAVVEQLGKESKNRLKRKETLAPVWVIVTSQEKLDEVVAAIDDKRVELAKLQDRFKYRVDLAPADIREVASKRVLSKTPEGKLVLRRLFAQAEGQLNAACRLDRTTRASGVTEQDFIQFYPYLPHFVDLSIDIMSGIRLEPGATRHLGGSNRTIIKQAYEMLVSDRTRMADRPPGTLVSLDLIYELVEGNLSTEKQKDISDITQRFKADPADGGWSARVAKAICLLQCVRDLPRTEGNIAALLADEVGKPAPVKEVKAALQRLAQAQFVRNSEDGWKLQSAQEKGWETERSGHMSPKPKECGDIRREVVGNLFADPKLKTHRYGPKNFRVGVTVDGVPVGDQGQITLSIVTAEDGEELPEKLAATRDESRLNAHANDVYWVFSLSQEIAELTAELHASRQMVHKYERVGAQHRMTTDEVACLDSEKQRRHMILARLRDKFLEPMAAGQGMFRGVARDASELGKTFHDSIRQFLEQVVPSLYPKLEMGARSLKGDEAEKVLETANLGGLPQVFYGGQGGLNLVVQDGSKYVPNTSAEIAQEVLNFLKAQQDYGTRVTGRDLEERFGGFGYGWERDVLRLVLAVLLRAGAIEVTYQGRRFVDHHDPQSRLPFTNNVAFKAASFAARQAVGMKTLTDAARYYEDLTGEMVDAEETSISAAFKQLVDEELRLLMPAEAVAHANDVPVVQVLAEYRQRLLEVKAAASDECVRLLAGQGASLKADREQVRETREALGEVNLTSLRRARVALAHMWPQLESRGVNEELAASAAELRRFISSPEFYRKAPQIKRHTGAIQTAYRLPYVKAHEDRLRAFSEAIEDVKQAGQWMNLPEAVRSSVLAELTRRACSCSEFPGDSDVCPECRATLTQMESDIAAVDGLRAKALGAIEELIAPPPAWLAHVRLAEFFVRPLDSTDAVDDAVDNLRQHLHKLVAAGARIILE